MDLISATDVTERARLLEASSSTLRAAVVDWLSSRQAARSTAVNAGGAEVFVARALEREKHTPTVCARLRRGVREAPVREVFTQCHAELVEEMSTAVTLLIEQQPIRQTLADEYCDITTNESAEHEFLFSSALRRIIARRGAEGNPHDGDRLLAVQLAEIAVAFPAVRDGLEELLWQHRK